MQSLCNTFWKDFKAPSKAFKYESPEFVKALISHMQHHGDSCQDCPAAMAWPVQVERLQKEHLPVLEAYSFHWSLQKLLRNSFRKHLLDPQPRTLHLIYDFEELPIQFCKVGF